MLREKLNKLTIKEIKGIIRSYNYHTKIVLTGRKKKELIDDLIKHLESDIVQNKVKTVINLEGEHKRVNKEIEERKMKQEQKNKVRTEMRLYEENVKVNKEMKEREHKKTQRKQIANDILNNVSKMEPKEQPKEQPEIDFMEYMAIESQFKQMTYDEILQVKNKIENSEKLSKKNKEIMMMIISDVIRMKKPKKEKVKKEKTDEQLAKQKIKRVNKFFEEENKRIKEEISDRADKRKEREYMRDEVLNPELKTRPLTKREILYDEYNSLSSDELQNRLKILYIRYKSDELINNFYKDEKEIMEELIPIKEQFKQREQERADREGNIAKNPDLVNEWVKKIENLSTEELKRIMFDKKQEIYSHPPDWGVNERFIVELMRQELFGREDEYHKN